MIDKEVLMFIVGFCIVFFEIYSIGFNRGCQYLLDIYTGKRKVKASKNPFLKRKESHEN